VPAEAPAWATRLVGERAALIEAVRQQLARGDRAAATELAARVWRAWVLARDEAAGRAFLALVLGAPGPDTDPRARALVLYGDGLLAFRLGDLAASRARSEAALVLARQATDPEAEGLALLGISRVDLSEGLGEEARRHAAASHARVRDLDPAYGQAPLHLLAQATRLAGALDEAAPLFEESLALNRQLGDAGMVIVELHNLGHVELRRGQVDHAERCFAECDALAGDSDDPYDTALRLFNRASVAFARGHRPDAAALLAQARALLAHAQVDLAADDAREFDELGRRLGP
jgi:tetratricopeptide (TPR) repeat protein